MFVLNFFCFSIINFIIIINQWWFQNEQWRRVLNNIKQQEIDKRNRIIYFYNFHLFRINNEKK